MSNSTVLSGCKEVNVWQEGCSSVEGSGDCDPRVGEQRFVATVGQQLFQLTAFEYAPGTNSLQVHNEGLLVDPLKVVELSKSTFFLQAEVVLAGDIIVASALTGVVAEVDILISDLSTFEIVLTDGQLSVLFPDDVPVLDSSVYINGLGVDNGRLVEGVNYTVNSIANIVTLTESYPAGTILLLTYNDTATPTPPVVVPANTIWYDFATTIGTTQHTILTIGATIVANYFNSSHTLSSGATFSFTGVTTIGKAGNIPDADGFFYDADGKQFVLADRSINVNQFGADNTGVIDATSAWNAARDFVDAKGGGIVRVPIGVYKLSEFTFGTANHVIFEGEGTAYDYEGVLSSAVIVNVTTGVFGIRIPDTALYCGLKNISLRSDGVLSDTPPNAIIIPGVEYGILIEASATILEEVSALYFQYGCTLASNVNSNVIDKCAFMWNTKCGLAVFNGSTGTYAAYHPNLTPPASLVSATVYTVSRTNIRSNGWGMIIRSGQGHFEDVVVESNFFGGLMAYFGSLDSPPQMRINQCYFEGNWRTYDKDAVYDITVNNFLRETISTFMVFDLNTVSNLNDAGYQINVASIASGTSAGGLFNSTFTDCIFHGSTGGVTTGKLIFLKSSFIVAFQGCAGSDGDGIDSVRTSKSPFLANGTHFYEWNGPTLPEPLGNRGMLVDFNRATGQPGGLIATKGAYQGLFGNLEFPAIQVPSIDRNVLDDYDEFTWTPAWSIGGSTVGITYGALQEGAYVKIGKLVFATGSIQLTSKGIQTGVLKITGLPFQVGNLQPGTSVEAVGVVGIIIAMANLTSAIMLAAEDGGNSMSLNDIDATGTAALDDTNLTDTTSIRFSIVYIADN